MDMDVDQKATGHVNISTAAKKELARKTGGKMARRVYYTEDIANEILGRLAEGETLTSICADKHLPTTWAVMDWVRTDKEGFQKRYEEARKHFFIRLADESLDIADDNSRDWKTIHRRGGDITVPDTEVVNRSKLRVEQRRWILSKVLPKEFGDYQQDDKATELAAGVMEIIKLVAGMAKQKVIPAEIIDITPRLE